MTTTRLPDIQLDDRTFQALVNEARLRIAEACPEWTEHNVSDPGITLIELFAWMTDMLVYRLNRVPDKLYVRLMELIGVVLDAPTAARTDVTFRLAAPALRPVLIPGRETEVATPRVGGQEPVVFQVNEDFTIPAARPVAYLVEKGGAVKDVGAAGGSARPQGSDQYPFSEPPKVGEALYLGFRESLGRLLMRIEMDCAVARGSGVEPEDPPLAWEVSGPDGQTWVPADVLLDSTGGFNYGSGDVELAMPNEHGAWPIGGHRLHWVRCRVTELTRSGHGGAAFTRPPEITAITAAPIGATIRASHAVHEVEEPLGQSDGTPGQRLQLANAPVLKLLPGETLEVMNVDTGAWEAWTPKDTFAESGPDDRHFGIDLASGLVQLGPAVRTGGGGWRRYGAVPPKGAGLRFTRYRHGGGLAGNITAGALNVLRASIPGVASVANSRPATGGVDPEPLDSARNRAAMELRTRGRAVTAEDFEYLCLEASARLARARCLEPREGTSAVRVHLVPRVDPADRELSRADLMPDEALVAEVRAYLDERRLIGTEIVVMPARYRPVRVVVDLQAALRSDPRRVEFDVVRALQIYLNPLIGGSMDGPGTGWGFGRPLNVGELYGVVAEVPGVDFVRMLRVYEASTPGGEQQAASHIVLGPDELITSARHVVRAEHQKA